MPLVSVIIPTCRRPELLARAIQSVLSQTYPPHEVIVVDDDPEKHAKVVVCAANDLRVKYVAHEQQRGAAAARNTGIRLATGDLIAFLDDDDEWNFSKLQKQVAALEQAGDSVGLVFCGVSLYTKAGQFLNQKIYPKEGVFDPLEPLLHKCFLWTSSLLYRKSFADRGFIFDEQFLKNQEWDLALRLASVTKFYGLKEALVRMTVLDDHEHMGGAANLPNILAGHEMLVAKYMAAYRQHPASLALRYFQIAGFAMTLGDAKKARQYFFLAWKTQKRNTTYALHTFVSLLGKTLYLRIKRV